MSLDKVDKPEELNQSADYEAMAKDHDRAIAYEQAQQTKMLANESSGTAPKAGFVSRFVKGNLTATGIAVGVVGGMVAGVPGAAAVMAATAVNAAAQPGTLDSSKFLFSRKNQQNNQGAKRDNTLTLAERLKIYKMGQQTPPRGLLASVVAAEALKKERALIEAQRLRVRQGQKTFQERVAEANKTGDDRPLEEMAKKNPVIAQKAADLLR